jgi:CRISPR/Cas system-associated exonuclease Cas4 (RecB family)
VYDLELTPVGPAKGHFTKGIYFHELSHVYYQMLEAGVEPGSDYALSSIMTRIKNDMAKTGLADRDLVELYASIGRMISKFISIQSPIVDYKMEVQTVEAELIYPISDEISLFGYADLLYRRDGRPHVRDHKTGERAWSKIDVRFSMQLLFYATLYWKMYGEVPLAEISYINSKEYKTKVATVDELFTFTGITYTEKELSIFYDDICKAVERMLSYEAFPLYGQHCRYCPFQEPCFLSRKGIDTSIVLANNFKKRDSARRHANFTESHTQDDEAD